ncbi:Acetyl-CoA carboxylase, carboxyltransferase component [Butyrivibrio sp. INlla18]|uniref:acyl-CoA carboxylase subunit beta n=1 Tax=Butyrivibrio sp. INlla18 TaxID=1520806 RepID=UPI00087FC14E|nr:carboxyl transferase domain-containing protein [Butyrivibrio sp. INlla18]MCR4758591.1 carboxyl transferase [Butyrivibrio sp.]SDA78307.1 Acetyl-CoA carboxylase, carboxyltransferase component [Butyrivibrio sp. INlla18]
MSSSSQASQRINALLDENSFVEIGGLVTARSTDFNLKQEETPSDGVVTGYGVINGNLVYVYSQDASVLGGSIGEMHAKKIVRLYELAIKTGSPVIGLIDSAGLRLQEATDALNAFGEIYLKQVEASGVVPQITAIFGTCGGGLALIPSITDFTFMEEQKAKLFVNSPNVLEGNYKEKCDTSAAKWQSSETGSVDVVADEASIYAQIRELVSILPSNNEDSDSYQECSDDLNRACENLDGAAADPALVAAQISDNGLFFETKRDYAKEMVTGFIKLNGATVGLVGNRTAIFDENGKEAEKFDGRLTAHACEKAADFVNFCDAFDLPVLTLTNSTGFGSSKCDEKHVAKAAGRLVFALANATVPKVNLITEKAFGSAYVVMNSKAIGADVTISWPDAQIGTMDANLAAKIICDGKDAETVSKTAAEYAQLQNNVKSAAARGYVDEIIEPADTRKYVIGAFEMLFTKRDERPAKKHGTV